MSARSGNDLLLAIQAANSDRPALVEEFLYERRVMLLAGEPGAGKSIIATQIALCLTQAMPLFGILRIPAPKNVYYLQLEGSDEESYERIQRMQQEIPWNSDRLCWDYRKGLDLLQPKEAAQLLCDISTWGKPDLVVIDPLYQAVYGELSKEMPMKAFTRFVDSVTEQFRPCSILIVHHTVKPSYDMQGKEIEKDDPFYGSQWLKAHVDISYLLKGPKTGPKDKVAMYQKKSRGSDTLKELFLHYDPESDTVTSDVPFEQRSGEERVLLYLRDLKKNGGSTDFFEVLEYCKVSARQLRRIQMALLKKGILKCDKRSAGKKIWEAV